MLGSNILKDILTRLERELARPSGTCVPWQVDGVIVGWLDPDRAQRLARFPGVFDVTATAVRFVATLATPEARTAALAQVARVLADEGALTAWRNELYAVGPDRLAPLCLLERAAARYFGIRTYAVHVNGLVEDESGPRMWIARRSASKAIDPGMLDNLVGGGLPAGASVTATVVKEAWEEAGIPPSLAATARAVGTLDIFRAQPDGLHCDTIYAHDLLLPADFVPVAQDGEVVGQQLVTLDDAAQLIANVSGPDVVTADASLVIIDCLLRRGFVPADAPEFLALAALGHPRLEPALRAGVKVLPGRLPAVRTSSRARPV